jgi:hypothetical protein
MTLPTPVAELWNDLQAVRADVLAEVDGLSQSQADFRPGADDWSIGEIVHHLTIAEIGTGKITTRLLKEAAAGGAPAVFPHDLTEFIGLPVKISESSQAPPVVWPEHGRPIAELVNDMKAARERSRESVAKLATCDPRALRFKHFRLGDLDLAQWWRLQAEHDGVHLAQIRDVKRAAGFPRT